MSRETRILERAIETYECMRVLLETCEFSLDRIEPHHVEALQLAYEIVRYVEKNLPPFSQE